MPYPTSEGARIFWQEEGTGEPVLLIMGLGYPAAMWNRPDRYCRADAAGVPGRPRQRRRQLKGRRSPQPRPDVAERTHAR